MATGIGLVGKSAAELAKIAFKEVRRLMLDTLRENQIDGRLQLITYPQQMGTPQVEGIIKMNTFYNKPTHTFYIEYDLNHMAEELYDTHRFKETFEGKLRDYFRKETYMYCNIIHPEEKVADQVDSAILNYPTPYTIGYWKSIMGRYEFIEDRQQIYADARIFQNPSDEIDHGKPVKRFEDFCAEVYQISQQYKHDALTDELKDEYLEAINNLARRYSRESQQYKNELRAINDSYNIRTNVNAKVPEMFNAYNVIYKKYFGKTLPNNILTQSRVIYLQIHPKLGGGDPKPVEYIDDEDFIDEENMQY